MTAARHRAIGGPSPRPRAGRRAEHHLGDRTGWLRAAVLGANDGIVSTASLVVGVASAGAEHRTLLRAGASALIAGAMSMAGGEFVSVHSQQDTEPADLAREQAELTRDPVGEHRELAGIYVARGLDAPLATRGRGRVDGPRRARATSSGFQPPRRPGRPRRRGRRRRASPSARRCRSRWWR